VVPRDLSWYIVSRNQTYAARSDYLPSPVNPLYYLALLFSWRRSHINIICIEVIVLARPGSCRLPTLVLLVPQVAMNCERIYRRHEHVRVHIFYQLSAGLERST